METFLSTLTIFLFGYWLGINVTMFKIRREILNLAKEQGIKLPVMEDEAEPDQKENPVPFLNIEQHGDMLYLFDRTSDVFMTQGRNIDELANNLSKYKQVELAYVKYGDDNFWFVNGKVSTKENESQY